MAKQAELTASYTCITSQPFSHSHTLTNLSSTSTTSVRDKSEYLAGLRSAVTTLQEQVNKDLTTRMEEDKARDAAKGRAAKSVDELKEEENYGEEVVEED